MHRSTFNTGHLPTASLLLPSTLALFDEQRDFANGMTDGDGEGRTNGHASKAPSLHHVLIASRSGSVALVTPLDERTYHRLSALQGHLTSLLEHPCGLNPRAYRNVESEEGLGGARGAVDGDILCRIMELGAGKRNDVLARAGTEAWSFRSDLEIVAGRGLGYL